MAQSASTVPRENPTSIEWIDRVMDDAVRMPFLDGELVVFTARRPGASGANQDAAALIPVDRHRGVIVVADGVGGHPSGSDAASLAIQAIRASIEQWPGEPGELRAAILDGIENANRAILSLSVGAATTVAIGEIDGNRVRPYHVGDSLILVVGQRAKRKFESIPHSPVGYAVEAGILDETEALQHAERNLVSNLVGSREMRIEIGPPIALARRDTVLLATDGLSDNLTPEEIVEGIRKGRLDRVARRLQSLCRSRMAGETEGPSKPDDLTFAVYRPGRD